MIIDTIEKPADQRDGARQRLHRSFACMILVALAACASEVPANSGVQDSPEGEAVRLVDDEAVVSQELARAANDPNVQQLMNHLQARGCDTSLADAVVGQMNDQPTVFVRSFCGAGYGLVISAETDTYAVMDDEQGGWVLMNPSEGGVIEQSYDELPQVYAGLGDIIKIISRLWSKFSKPLKNAAGSVWNLAYCMVRCGAANASSIVACAEDPSTLVSLAAFIGCVAPTAWTCVRQCL